MENKVWKKWKYDFEQQIGSLVIHVTFFPCLVYIIFNDYLTCLYNAYAFINFQVILTNVYIFIAKDTLKFKNIIFMHQHWNSGRLRDWYIIKIMLHYDNYLFYSL